LEGKSSTGMNQNVAGLLCYILGWITGIVFVIIEKESKFVLFHAWQSIFTFAGLMVASFVLGLIPILNLIIVPLVRIFSFILWIVLLVKSYEGEMWRVPVAGNYAAKQVGLEE